MNTRHIKDGSVMIIAVSGHAPDIADDAYVAEGAKLIGRLTVEREASVWFNAVVRADADRIVIGESSNVQDNATIHCDPGFPTLIGKYVTIGHNAIVHGCIVEDNVLIGMHSTILTGSTIGQDSIIGAHALVTEGAVIPAGSLVVGVPGKVVRSLRPDEIERVRASAESYRERARLYGTSSSEVAIR
jgi:carbonic anhydrase/acetyltransferase-like protein (isoleucine patch superfamily)